MSFLISLFVLSNFLWLCYLTYIVYKKNSNKNQAVKKIDIPVNTKVNLTRFNPFDDLGGDQSFILCILDSTNSGVIITSLHHRDLTRIYAKTIKSGEGDGVTLSKEEKLAILKTIKN